MRTAEAGMKGGSYVDASALRGVGDFGISVFYRAGRSQRAAPSPLNRLPGDGILSAEQFVAPSAFATDSAPTSGGIAARFQIGDTLSMAASPGYPIGTRGTEVTGVNTLGHKEIQWRKERTLL